MYQHILIPLENSAADETILAHIKPLARLARARILLVHVADGWVARNFDQLKLAESEEMKQDRVYLEQRQRELLIDGFSCDAVLALGEPSDEIIKLARDKDIDLIAMTTHGHRFISDILYGATVDKVRHAVDIPVFVISPGMVKTEMTSWAPEDAAWTPPELAPELVRKLATGRYDDLAGRYIHAEHDDVDDLLARVDEIR